MFAMNERDYGVGIANRYALFMGEEGADPLSEVVRGPKGKENKQQDKAAASNKKAQPVAAAAAPVTSKTASSKNTTGPAAPPAASRTNNNHTGPSGRQQAQQQSAAPAGPAAKSGQRDGKPPAAAQQAKQQQQQRPPQQQADQTGAATRPSPRAEERQRPDRAPGIAFNCMDCMMPDCRSGFRTEPCARSPCAQSFPHTSPHFRSL